MSAGLRDLYQDVILDHQRSPRNFHKLDDANHTAEGHNPLCGDKVTVYVNLDDGRIGDVSFEGVGCAICTSSASMMTTLVKGKSIEHVEGLFASFHALLTEDDQGEARCVPLGKLEIFAGVRNFPIRVKCATLPWHTLRAAVQGREEPVTTE